MPVNVLTGTQDDIVPHPQARQLALDWCSKGANVTYTPVVQLLGSGGTALNHLGPMLTNQGDSEAWLVDRLKGKGTGGNCLTAGLMP